MSDPKTLLEMSGAPMEPSKLSDSALVLIDCQNEYVSGVLALPGVTAALKEAKKVLARARDAGSPIIHVVHHGRPGGGVFDPEGPSSEIAPDVAATNGEAIVPKALPNAFAGTNLNVLLEETGKKELIIVGFMTHMCVSATARAATDLGYRNTIVATATATRDLPGPNGEGVVSA
ncbi:MAG: cysteine hydrolase, partial [Rhodospirillales bacterium]|nr:cysteine hydrolase [Rhodospirillales bacterium]